MSQTWFYCGGWTPQCWSSTLKVEDERLFGRRGRQYCEILATDIVEVKEFGFNNPFVLVTTAEGRFHVGALTKHYDDVVRVLERYIGSGFCRRFVHRWNVLVYRTQFKVISLVASAFRGKGAGGSDIAGKEEQGDWTDGNRLSGG
jgi:hypothetical protein